MRRTAIKRILAVLLLALTGLSAGCHWSDGHRHHRHHYHGYRH